MEIVFFSYHYFGGCCIDICCMFYVLCYKLCIAFAFCCMDLACFFFASYFNEM